MRTSSLVFLRIVVISVNPSQNHWWFVLVYDNFPTLVEQPIHMHLGSSHQVPYLHGNHFTFPTYLGMIGTPIYLGNVRGK